LRRVGIEEMGRLGIDGIEEGRNRKT